jgi:hypothetical protein
MLTNRLVITAPALALLALTVTGCPDQHSDPPPGSDAAVDTDPPPSPTPDASLPITQNRSAIGTSCSRNEDCSSGFCTDGVCCDSACGQTCFSCATIGKVGNCAPIASGPDISADTPCSGGSTCILDRSTSLPECKVAELQPCKTNSDCATNNCVTFFVDADGDGYGTPTEAQICTTLGAAPPPGYALLTGDCCDIDRGANPGVPASTYFGFPDACGSYDWNCDAKVEQQQVCPYDSSVACGANCNGVTPFGSYTLFVELCH